MKDYLFFLRITTNRYIARAWKHEYSEKIVINIDSVDSIVEEFNNILDFFKWLKNAKDKNLISFFRHDESYIEKILPVIPIERIRQFCQYSNRYIQDKLVLTIDNKGEFLYINKNINKKTETKYKYNFKYLILKANNITFKMKKYDDFYALSIANNIFSVPLLFSSSNSEESSILSFQFTSPSSSKTFIVFLMKILSEYEL